MREDVSERLDTLGAKLAAIRSEAVQARKSSGIEAVWTAAEEAYLGIDDANRHEFAGAKWAKPTSIEGPVTTNRPAESTLKSNVFVRLTSRYVDAGTAKLSEILLSQHDRSFSFDPTPVPDLIAQKDDPTPLADEMGQPVMRPATPEEAPIDPNNPQPQPPQVQATVGDLVKAELDKAKKSAEKAEDRIYDWMVECQWTGENRKVIFDAGRLGVGVLKGPYPEVQKTQALLKQDDGVSIEIKKKIVPAFKWVDPWNIFPDPACGEKIACGDYVWERDFISQRMLKELKGREGYIDSQIDKVIKEGPGKCNDDSQNPSGKDLKSKDRFEIWYFTGVISRDEICCANPSMQQEIKETQNDVFAVVTMVNDTVIRATINPLDSGKFPYHEMQWSRRPGHWAGVGIAEQIAMPQRMVNAATRSLLNNAGISSGAQFVLDAMSITPADGSWAIVPNKVWFKTEDSQTDDVRKAFMAIEFPNIQGPLMSIVDYAFKLAEEACNIPLITQGIVTGTTPDTFGATQIQDNNANTLLRNIGYQYDVSITEPAVNMAYEWLLLDPNVPNDEKGDFKINAHGSTALVDRAIQDQTLMQLGQLVINPAFGTDPKKWFAEYLKSKRLDPSKLQYTKEEQEQLSKQQPPPPVQVQVAQVRAQADQAKTQAQIQAQMQLAQMDNGDQAARLQQEQIRSQTSQQVAEAQMQADIARSNKDLQLARENREFELRKLELQREIAILGYTEREKVSLNEAKVALTKAQMDNQTKKELAAAEIALAQRMQDKDHATSLIRDEISTPKTP